MEMALDERTFPVSKKRSTSTDIMWLVTVGCFDKTIKPLHGWLSLLCYPLYLPAVMLQRNTGLSGTWRTLVSQCVCLYRGLTWVCGPAINWGSRQYEKKQAYTHTTHPRTLGEHFAEKMSPTERTTHELEA